VSVPAVVTAMPDRVVWLPENAGDCDVHRDLGAAGGSVVSIAAGSAAEAGADIQAKMTATSAGSDL
ncbi:hypothetical protein ACFQZU_04140, partial [Streptomonospora algeriensis]